MITDITVSTFHVNKIMLVCFLNQFIYKEIDEWQITNDPQGGTNHPKSLFADFNFDLILIAKAKF
jgi:hypothetical protein